MSLGKAYIEIVGDVKRFAPALRRDLTAALRLGAVGGVATVAAGQLLQVAGALSQVAGAAVAAPAGIAVTGAAIGTLTLATKGLGKAFAAAAGDDAKAFDKALEGLSPAARDLAREVHAIAPELNGLRTAAQDAFARPLIGQITATAGVLSGPLRAGLSGVAAEYGLVARRALEFARESATVSLVGRVFTATREIIASTGSAIVPVLGGFRDLAGVALPTLTRIASLAGPLASQFGAWLSEMARSGGATRVLDNAVAVLGQLGRLAVNVGSILSQVLGAAAQGGGTLLFGRLVALTSQLAAFLHTADGQQALATLFATLNTAAGALAPVVTALVGLIAHSLLPALAGVVGQAGPALAGLVAGLTPALQALIPAAAQLVSGLLAGISALGPALGPAGQVIASIASALAPLLPVIGQLVAMLVGPLATALAAIGPLTAPLIQALAPILVQIGQTLAAVLAPAAQLIAQLFTQLGPPIGQIVAALGTALTPVLQVLAPIASALISALMPLLPAIVSLLTPVTQIVVALTPLLQVVAQLAVLAVQLAAPLIKLVAVLVQLLVSKAVAPLIGLIARELTKILSPLTSVADWLSRLSGLIAGINWGAVGSAIGDAFASAWHAVLGFFSGLGQFLMSLPGRFIAALAALPGLLWRLLKGAFDQGLRAVGVGIGLLVFTVTQLPQRIMAGLSSLVSRLAGFFSSLWQSAVRHTASGINSVASFVAGLPGRVSGALQRLPGVLAGLWNSAWSAASRAVASGVSTVVRYVTGVPGRLAGLAARFVSAGASLIGGFLRGLRRVGSLGDIAASITNAVKNGLNKVIDRINSGIADIDDLLPGTLPRIPRLANGAILRRPGLFIGGEAGAEVVIPLTRPKRARELAAESGLLDILAGTTGGGPGGVVIGAGAISVTFEGAVPTQQEAFDTGRAVGEGLLDTLARRDVATTVRTI